MTAPVLFLDFDGVLHPENAARMDWRIERIVGENLFCWLPLLEKLLAPYPELRILVTSDWRRHFSNESLKDLLGPLGSRFLDVVLTYSPSRYEEIATEADKRQLQRWLALDDHSSVQEAAAANERLIWCPPAEGLSSERVQRELTEKLDRLMS
jgi:hypothetical protein